MSRNDLKVKAYTRAQPLLGRRGVPWIACAFLSVSLVVYADAHGKPNESVESQTAQQILDDIRIHAAPITVVNLWATWCPPCRREIPAIQEVHEELRGKGLRLVLISGDDRADEPKILQFLKSVKWQGPVVRLKEVNASEMRKFSADWNGGLPVTFFYDSHGNRKTGVVGELSAEKLRAHLRRIYPALFEPPAANSDRRPPRK